MLLSGTCAKTQRQVRKEMGKDQVNLELIEIPPSPRRAFLMLGLKVSTAISGSALSFLPKLLSSPVSE